MNTSKNDKSYSSNHLQGGEGDHSLTFDQSANDLEISLDGDSQNNAFTGDLDSP